MRFYWVTVTYETFTEESLTEGGSEDNGFVDAAIDPMDVPREKSDMSFKHSMDIPEVVLDSDIRHIFRTLEDLADFIKRNDFWGGEDFSFHWDIEVDPIPPRDLTLQRSQVPDYIPSREDDDAAINMTLHFGNLTGKEILEVLKMVGIED
jgi:hypothetical protein